MNYLFSNTTFDNRQLLKTLWEKKKLLLLFPQCFLLNQIIASPFVHIFVITSSYAAELEEPKIGISGKGLKNLYNTYLKNCQGFQQVVLLQVLLNQTDHTTNKQGQHLTMIVKFHSL